jgi:glycosyltransferase involved in cell wall biosynthesis
MLVLARERGQPALDLRGRGALSRLAAACREHEIDVVNAHSIRWTGLAGLLRWSRRVRAPLVTTIHNVHDRRNDWLSFPILSLCPDVLLFVSRYEQSRLAGRWGRRLGRVVHTGIDLVEPEQVAPVDLAERHGIARDARVLGFVGRLSLEKGLDDALEALVALPPDVVLCLVGSGPDRERLEAEVARRGLAERVCFAGQRDDVLGYLRSFELLLLPSRRESLPVVLREAGMMKLACVAADVGGVAEIVVPTETGLLYPSGDAVALTRAIGELLDDPERARALGRRARERVCRLFSSEHWIDETERIFEEVCVRRTSG